MADGPSIAHTDPEGYARYGGGVECIEAIRSALTPEEFRGFCKGNAIKYIWREGSKGGIRDIYKAADYLSMVMDGKWMHSEGHFDAVDGTAEAYIYRMPDGTLGIQCGNCGALLPQLRVPAGRRSGMSVPARCPECGSEIAGIQGTGDCEEGD